MGLVGAFRSGVSNVASATVDVVSETTEAVVDTADNVVDGATDTATSVFDGVSEFLPSPPTPSLPGLFNPIQQAREKAFDFAEGAADATISAANDGYQLAGDLARAGPNAALDLADRGLSLADRLAPDGGRFDRVLGGARNAVDFGKDALKAQNRLQETVGGLAESLAHAGVHGARRVAEDPIGTAEDAIEFVRDTSTLLAIEGDIEELGPGDSYSLAASLDGSVFGLAARLKGSQTITKNDDGSYTLAVSGQAGVGLMSRTGTTGAGTLSADAFANQGATVEFKFDSAEEAAEAARTFMGPIAGGISGALDGGLQGAIDGATPDYDSLLENISAVALSPSVSASVLAEAGFGGGSADTSAPAGKPGETQPPANILGINAGVSGEAAVGARIEFGDKGPPKLILSQSVKVTAANSATIPGLQGRVGGGGSVTVQESFELPEDFSIGDAVKDPLDTAKELASNAKRTDQVSVTLSANVNGGLKANLDNVGDKGGDALEAKLKFTGGTKDILDSGAIKAALKGDFSRAYSALAKITQLEASLTPIKTESTALSYKAGDGVDAVGGSFSATTIDRQDPIFEYKGTAKKATDQLAQALKQHRFGFIRG